jgi:uncharacterized protein
VRIAIDSSVLIAAQISRAGVCAELLEDVLMRHELITSEFILAELRRKLSEKFNYFKGDLERISELLRRASILVEPVKSPPDVCRDANDVPVLGTAVAGNCSFLISVDRDLLDLQVIHGIPIIRPGEYWRRAHEAG